jgi:hypothetical protein
MTSTVQPKEYLISYKEGSTYKLVPGTDYIFLPEGYNNYEGKETYVKVIKFIDTITCQELKIQVNSVNSGNILAFREIGVFRDMAAEFDLEYQSLIDLLHWDLRD